MPLHNFAAMYKMKKMKNLPIILFLIIGVSVGAFATGEKETETRANTNTSVSISGSVQDMTSSEKLVCAKIEIDELDLTIFTDILGNYTIPEINPGIYTFKVSYIAYEKLEMKEIEINSEKELNIQLKPL